MKLNQYSKTGSYHVSRNEENQDAVCSMETEKFILAILADGVTACKYGKQGAEMACEAVKNFVKHTENLWDFSEEKLAYLLLEHVMFYLEMGLNVSASEIQEYASTLMFAYIEKKTGDTLIFNLGDGALYEATEDGLQSVIKPQRYYGNPCLTTVKGAFKYASVRKIFLPTDDALLLCSDGFWYGLDSKRSKQWNSYIRKGTFAELNAEIEETQTEDDCSYIVVTRNRKSA